MEGGKKWVACKTLHCKGVVAFHGDVNQKTFGNDDDEHREGYPFILFQSLVSWSRSTMLYFALVRLAMLHS